MRSVPTALIVAALFMLPLSRDAFAQISAQQVRDSIDDAIQFLREEQRPNGRWTSTEVAGKDGGVTALVTLSMLNAGVSPADEQVQKSLQYLRSLRPEDEGTYTNALMTMVLCMAEPERDIELIRGNVEWFERTQVREGINVGGWGYGMPSSYADNSNSQFAVLALHEATRVGVEVDNQTWGRSRQYWIRGQLSSGAWRYHVPDKRRQEGIGARQLAADAAGTGSMTCAGLAGMIIASENYRDGDDAVVDGQIRCCGASEDQTAIENGLRWLARVFTVRENPGPRLEGGAIFPLYYLYALERVGRLSGRRFIGDHDWYREGAEFWIDRQDDLVGSWRGATEGPEADPVVATSLVLLFLSKGKRPILISKYRHDDGSDWDRHPKGIHFLTRELETLWEQPMNWQSVDGRIASSNDLLSAPVVFISGKDQLRLDAKQKRALREYVDNGGFIFAEACNGDGCDGREFDQRFRALMRELFPVGEGDPLQPLPADHPIWFADRRLSPDPERPLLGVQACCRTSVVYCPRNLSCLWRMKQPARYEAYLDQPAIKAKIDSAIDIGINVLTYATNRELKDKLDRPQIVAGEDDDLRARDVLTIPKLAHAGGSDDAPVAWPNALKVFEQQLELRVDARNSLVAPDNIEVLSRYPILFMHGRRDFQFTEAQRATLRSYFENGGSLFADAICAGEPFTDAFRREVQNLFPGGEWRELAADHPLYTRQFRGFDLSSVTLNTPTRIGTGPLTIRKSQSAPRLEGIEVDGRLVVIFSPYDLSCALENAVSSECKGYDREDAARIAVNVLLYLMLN